MPYPPTTPRIDWSNSLGHHAAHPATDYDHHETPTASTDCENAPSMITLSPGSWVSNWSAGTTGQSENVNLLNNVRSLLTIAQNMAIQSDYTMVTYSCPLLPILEEANLRNMFTKI